MCQLLGLNFNKVVRPQLSFSGFRTRASQNPHGWGIARYEGKACQVLKEPVTAMNSQLSNFLRDYEAFESKTIIAHVRYASFGEPKLANTHPFVRTFRQRDVAFAHNGTLGNLPSSGLTFHPVGGTDSEQLFCLLLTRLSREEIKFTEFGKIETLLREYNRFGTMNLLFSDSERLFCYRDENNYTGLWYTERSAPYGKIRMQDEDWEIRLDEKKSASERGFVIASRPLTDESWKEIKAGSLMVLQDGNMVYGPGVQAQR